MRVQSRQVGGCSQLVHDMRRQVRPQEILELLGEIEGEPGDRRRVQGSHPVVTVTKAVGEEAARHDLACFVLGTPCRSAAAT